MVLVGTSGWQYAHWRARFYPARLPTSAWLAHYAARFDVVEVNNTFYRLPARGTFEAWHAGTPDGFVFAVKMSRFLTHMKRLKDAAPAVRRFLDAAVGLGDKLGPLLVQLSPRHAADPARLDEALAAFPRGLRVAVEVRHPSWHADEVRRVLERRGAAFCLADRAGPLGPSWRTAEWGYVRFHGGRAQPPGCYGTRALETWAERLCALYPARAPLYVFFNNDAHGCALRDAVTLARLLAGRGREPSRVPSRAEARVG